MEESQRRGIGDRIRVDDSLVLVSLELAKHQVLIGERADQVLPDRVKPSARGTSSGIEEHEHKVFRWKEVQTQYRLIQSRI